MEEDDKIREMFQSFQPELSSDSLFMSRLKRNMESVEMVKQYERTMRRRNRIAVCVAACVGFVMGVLLTLLMPLIADAVTTFAISIPNHGLLDVNVNWQALGWVATGLVSVFTAINAYELTVAKLSAQKAPTYI